MNDAPVVLAAARAEPPTNAELFARSCARLAKRIETDPALACQMAAPHACDILLNECVGSMDFLRTACELYAHRPALGARAERVNAGGAREALDAFETITYRTLWERIRACAAGFARLDVVRRGDRVGLVGFAGIAYVIAQYAAWYLGASVAPLPSALGEQELAALVNNARLRALILDEQALASAEALRLQCPSVEVVVDMNGDATLDALASERAGLRLAQIIALGETLDAPPPAGFAADEDPVRILLYTSGSTGLPKAAQLTESAMIAYWRKAASDFRGNPAVTPPVPRANIGLAFMPMNHVRGQLNVIEALAQGGLLNFTLRRDLSTLFEDIRLARPTVVILVPRVAQSIQAYYERELARRSRGRDEAQARTELDTHMREHFLGDRLWIMRIGSAPASEEILHFLRRTFDVPVHTGYGSTEAGMILADERVLRANVLELRLDDVPELGYAKTDRPWPRGELLIRSRCMTIGYAGQESATAELFDENGFLRSGDIFEQRGEDHYVWLGRKSNIVKLAHGEYVSPWLLESLYASNSAAISQIFVYVNSLHARVMAVVVPEPAWLAARESDTRFRPGGEVATAIAAELRRVAAQSNLHAYEIPTDILIERELFSTRNGLLTESGKLARRRLEAVYGPMLDERRVREEDDRRATLSSLLDRGDMSVQARVMQTIRTVLKLPPECALFERSFREHGGDSLDATELAGLLEQLCGVPIPPGLILDPRKDALDALCRYIAASADDPRAAVRYRAVHGHTRELVTAGQLRSASFFDDVTPGAPAREDAPRHVLLTGANGFFGRALLHELLERGDERSRVTCMVRAESDAAALERLKVAASLRGGAGATDTIERALATRRLTVIAGDLAQRDLGLMKTNWTELAHSVDAIVHNGALVNHAFSYAQLFEPNVLGTVEVARLAASGKIKPVNFVSSIAVADLRAYDTPVQEHVPAAELLPAAEPNDTYGNGYALSKWAAEIVLECAREKFGVPVRIVRCSMLLPADGEEPNNDDFLARLIVSLASTGIAPRSFYLYRGQSRSIRSFHGLPASHVARFIATLAYERATEPAATFHAVNRPGESISLDHIVDWLIDEGFPLRRIDEHSQWFDRFSEGLQRLSPELRARTSLPILHQWSRPLDPDQINQFDNHAFEQRFMELASRAGTNAPTPPVGRAQIRRYIDGLGIRSLLATD